MGNVANQAHGAAQIYRMKKPWYKIQELPFEFITKEVLI
jgi:hypothetical protein